MGGLMTEADTVALITKQDQDEHLKLQGYVEP